MKKILLLFRSLLSFLKLWQKVFKIVNFLSHFLELPIIWICHCHFRSISSFICKVKPQLEIWVRSRSWLGSLNWPIAMKGTLWSEMMLRGFIIPNRFICCLKKFTGHLQLIISRLSLVLSKTGFFFLTVRRIRSFCSFSRIVHLIHQWFQIKRIQRLFGFLLWILVT